MKSWIEIPPDTDFTIHNIPFGIFSTPRRDKRIGTIIGNRLLDLRATHQIGLFEDDEIPLDVFYQNTLNEFIRLGKKITVPFREKLQALLSDPESPLKENPNLFIKEENVQMHMPIQVGDYTDFYSSIEHATNVGKMFRDPENALLPNWRHLPVGYHGRSSSIVVSGTDFHRPNGQILNKNGVPIFSASRRVDFELEMAFIVGGKTQIGQAVSTNEARDFIFGMVLFNDWSARDIQKWEYVPLGPFLGKNFLSSISPWVVTIEALEPFKVQGPIQEPPVLDYLQTDGPSNYDIILDVYLRPNRHEEKLISSSNFRYMYWNMFQQLAHHTVNGCNINIGDLMASGTISGPESGSYGSLLELSWGGKKPLDLGRGLSRTFLEDNDTVVLRAHAGERENRVGFGEVSGMVLPAKI